MTGPKWLLKRVLWLVPAALLLASALPAENRPTDRKPAFGEAAAGVAVSLEIKPATWKPAPDARYGEGLKIEFLCTVKNVGDKPVKVPAWGLDAPQVLEFTDAKGKVLPSRGVNRHESRPVTPNEFKTIAAGGSETFTLSGWLTDTSVLTVNELLGGAYTVQLATGDYTVRAVFESTERVEWSNGPAEGKYWTGKALSQPVKVTVAPKPAAK